MDTSQVFGVLTAIVGLAIVSVAIINGDKVAKIFTAGGSAFSQSITAATHPMQAK
jgi:Flp pilus assembly pilin Flp